MLKLVFNTLGGKYVVNCLVNRYCGVVATEKYSKTIAVDLEPQSWQINVTSTHLLRKGLLPQLCWIPSSQSSVVYVGGQSKANFYNTNT